MKQEARNWSNAYAYAKIKSTFPITYVQWLLGNMSCEIATLNSWYWWVISDDWLMTIMLCSMIEYEHCWIRNFMSYYVAYRFLFALHLYLSIVHCPCSCPFHYCSSRKRDIGPPIQKDYLARRPPIPKRFAYEKGVKKWKKPAIQTPQRTKFNLK